MSAEAWFVFVGVWFVAGLPLGPNAMNCIAVSAEHGFVRSLWAVLGILIAALCYKLAVIAGVAALLLANAELFQLIKLCGAAYLVWMGISLWRKGGSMPEMPDRQRRSTFQIAGRAFLISMSNPKAVFAYAAVFSQFINLDAPLASQLVVLVPTALIITALVYLGYCALGLGVGRLFGSVRRRLLFNRTVGSFYLFAAAALAFSGVQDRPDHIR